MKTKQSSMKVADEFKTFIKRACVNHGYAKKAEKIISQAEMQLRIINYFKLNESRYIEFINMGDEQC